MYNDEGKLFGFVVAGNAKTRTCLFVPSFDALLSVCALLEHRKMRITPTTWYNKMDRTDMPPIRALGITDEDATTITSSLPPPSVFSQRLDRGTPSTIAQSTTATSYDPRPGTSLRGDERQTGRFRTKSDFLEDQVVRLRRELERAWEIIGEKDEHLKRLITGERGLELSGDAIPQNDLEALKAEIETNRGRIEEYRSLWRRQADDSEQLVRLNERLAQMNEESDKRIMQAIDAIHKLHGSRTDADGDSNDEELMKIAFDLEIGLPRPLFPKRTPTPADVKTERRRRRSRASASADYGRYRRIRGRWRYRSKQTRRPSCPGCRRRGGGAGEEDTDA